MTDMMVQNSISQKPVEQKTSSAKNRIPTVADYEKYQLGAIPYEAKGHLVKTPIWKAPVVAVEDTFQNIKNIGKGIKGQSNDHELGQMNDLTMKAGGLALAGYLATKRVLPTKKGMEFVGFASFFTSMVLFPKLFINAPIKAMYGFNVDQKYVDSYGRKKSFHMDPQYTPYDLYAPEQLEKIGDKMGVDQDMENRQDFVKRKMSKIATQSNTMWMLTAGLATPIMGALLSSEIEKGLNKTQQNLKTATMNKKFANIDTPKLVENKALKELLTNNLDKKVDGQFVDQLVKLMDKDSNAKMEEFLRKDLNNILNSNKESDISCILGDIKLELPNSTAVIFDKKDIKKCLTEGDNLNSNQEIKPDEIKKRLNVLFQKEMDAKYPENVAGNDDLVTALSKKFNSAIDAKLNTPTIKLTEAKMTTIQEAAKAIDAFSAKKKILTEYVDHRIGNKEDSVVAREWKKASEGIMNAMGFSFKELEQSKKSPTKARELMEAKMTAIAKDDKKYETALGKIATLIKTFDDKVGEDNNKFKTIVEDKTKSFHTDFAAEAKKSSLTNVAEYIAGNHASALNNATESVENSIVGEKSSLYKVIQGLDMFKRLEEGSIQKELKDKRFPKSEESVEKTIKAMKYAIMDGTYGDHYVKFDIAEPKVYQGLMTNLFGSELSGKTKEVLGKKENGSLLTNVQDNIKELHNQLGNFSNRFLPDQRVDLIGTKEEIEKFADKRDLKKQSLTGETLSQFTKKAAEQMGNTKVWLKGAAGVGAVVAAVTLVSPFFFGKMETPKKKEVEHNG